MKRRGPARKRGLQAIAIAAGLRKPLHVDQIAGRVGVDPQTARAYVEDAIDVGLVRAFIVRNMVCPAAVLP